MPTEQPKVGAQIEAMVREAFKDIRQTMNEVFFGQGEHMAEAGTPMNPTQQQVTQEQGNFHGYNAQLDQIAQGLPSQEQGQDRSR